MIALLGTGNPNSIQPNFAVGHEQGMIVLQPPIEDSQGVLRARVGQCNGVCTRNGRPGASRVGLWPKGRPSICTA